MNNHYNKIFMFLLLNVLLLFMSAGSTTAQVTWDPGTGVDGSYTASVNTTLAGGTYNFTDFTINPGVTVTVTGNTPLIIRSTGNVVINGSLLADGSNGADGVTYNSGGAGGTGVAGGYNGGNGSFSSPSGPIDGIDGAGPGGVGNKGFAWSGGGGAGYASVGGQAGPGVGFGGNIYNDAQLTYLPGGSGGGGGSGGYDCGAGGGGAGGGMIAINSGTSIDIGALGSISVNGGNGGSDGTGNCGGGGAGSGGTIWLASPSFTHLGILSGIGGIGGASAVPGSPYYGIGGNGSEGRIRVDYNGPLVVTGTNNPPIGYHTTVGTPLPVLIQQLNGMVSGPDNIIYWNTVMEKNNHHFVLQHSTDALNFVTIETIQSKGDGGNSNTPLNYSFVHRSPKEGHNYYRLYQVDIDGKSTEFARTIDIVRHGYAQGSWVYPNPVSDVLYLSTFVTEAETVSVTLRDMSARKIWQQQFSVAKGLFEHSFNMQNLPRGMYVLEIENGSGTTEIRKVQKL